MTTVRKRGEKTKYSVVNSKCIGCTCFQPGIFQIRGATGSSTRDTGDTIAACLRRENHGCPDEKDKEYSLELFRQRKDEGWTNLDGRTIKHK